MCVGISYYRVFVINLFYVESESKSKKTINFSLSSWQFFSFIPFSHIHTHRQIVFFHFAWSFLSLLFLIILFFCFFVVDIRSSFNSNDNNNNVIFFYWQTGRKKNHSIDILGRCYHHHFVVFKFIQFDWPFLFFCCLLLFVVVSCF